MSTTFGIPLWAELVAVGLGALQGGLFAGMVRDRRIDLLGVVLIGIGVALGGSLLRDILLGVAPVVVRGEWYVLTAAALALVGMLLPRLFARLDPVILVLDAVTIGLFGAIGASKALALGVPPVPAVFVGAAAAVGGSVVRDVTLGQPVALLHVGSLYAIAAAAGAAVLVGLAAIGVDPLVAALAGVVVTTVLRLLAVALGWTFPEQRPLNTQIARHTENAQNRRVA
ncbi:TRIC cation channel family protein [Cellulosimicrobium terreum]|nr:TRIC cation channel family protein [Cellulosimicrobium terreum]